MDSNTLEILKKNPEIDTAVCAAVRLAVDAIKRDGRGEAGIALIFQGTGKPIRYREVTSLVFQS